MADDFGDFADFSSAFPTTTNATTSNSAQGSELKGDGSQAVTDKVDNFFASFPSGTSSDNVNFSFGFDEQLEGLTSQGGFTNFDLTNTNIADIHIPLDLPSPPGVDVHMAGGVPFDIPPIPISPSDEEDTTPTFSKWPQTLENGAQSIVQNTSTGNTKNSAVLTLLPAATTNAASHESTVPVTGVLTGGNLKPLLNVGGDMNGSDINSTVGGLSSSTHVSGGIQDEEEFGDFESSLTFSNPKTMESVQNVGIDTTAGSSEVQLPLPDDGLKSKDDSFGSFVADTSQKTQTEGHMGFGAFESGTETSLSDTNKKEEKQAAFETSQFADFSAFKQSSEQTQQQSVGNSEFGNFEAFTNSNEMKKGDNSQFADFGNFSTFEQASVPEATEQETSGFGDFEMFSNRTENSMKSQTRSTGQAGESNIASFKSAPSLTSGVNKDVTTAGGGSEFITDFTAFHSTNNTSSTTDDFGNFSAFTGQTTASNADAEFGDFSGAEDSKSNTAGNISGGSKDDFGDFSSNDDFGDFSTSAFGNFSNVPAALTSVQPESSGAVKTMKANVVLEGCFTGTGSQKLPHVSTTTSLDQRLLKEQQSSDTQGVWWVLQKCVDFTVPLHKWDNSYMQDNFYGALKIDPLLASKPATLTILTSGMAQFEAPLGGVTAAEDLIESFGFQGDLEVSPTANKEFRLGSPGAPALLDLSLPATPTSPTNKDSFTLAKDLMGLDLNPQQQSQPLSSVEELVRNERLVVSKSTWVDSKLLELGGNSSMTSGTTSPSSNNSQPSTPRSGKKQNSVEFQLLQLGLDVSKTTFTSGSSNGELSLSARSVLGRLPDLSFMLSREEIIHSTYYSRSK